MFKRIVMIMVAVCFVMGMANMSMAQDEGNKRKGKYTYRKVYQTCSERGEVTSPKPILNPDSKTQAQWTRVFETKEFSEFGCKQEWEALSQEDINDIYAYLHGHAADSPTPAKCK